MRLVQVEKKEGQAGSLIRGDTVSDWGGEKDEAFSGNCLLVSVPIWLDWSLIYM